jgi:hypothetical protein
LERGQEYEALYSLSFSFALPALIFWSWETLGTLTPYLRGVPIAIQGIIISTAITILSIAVGFLLPFYGIHRGLPKLKEKRRRAFLDDLDKSRSTDKEKIEVLIKRYGDLRKMNLRKMKIWPIDISNC